MINLSRYDACPAIDRLVARDHFDQGCVVGRLPIADLVTIGQSLEQIFILKLRIGSVDGEYRERDAKNQWSKCVKFFDVLQFHVFDQVNCVGYCASCRWLNEERCCFGSYMALKISIVQLVPSLLARIVVVCFFRSCPYDF